MAELNVNEQLADAVVTPELIDAVKLVAHRYNGKRGEFSYAAFDHINQAFFDGELPLPLILWHITPYGRCIGYTRPMTELPIIVLHPSLLGGSDVTKNPWDAPAEQLGLALVYDVLLHECIHVSVQHKYGGWHDKGQTSHNNTAWIAEVNRIAQILGFDRFKAGMSKARRKPIPGEYTKTGKPETKVVRDTPDDCVDFGDVASFPHPSRAVIQPEFYRQNQLPFDWQW